MNAKQAFPEIILNLDRPRKAVFNLRALNALSQHFEKTKGIRQIWKAIDWNDLNTEDATVILWACLLTDADDHKEHDFTYEKMERIGEVAELLASFDRLLILLDDVVTRAMPVMTDDDVKRRAEELQKKTKKLQKQSEKALAKSTSSNSSHSPS